MVQGLATVGLAQAKPAELKQLELQHREGAGRERGKGAILPVMHSSHSKME